MDLHNAQTYYDVLEVSPDATHQDIRSAYIRLKSAYSKDNLALYSLLDQGEKSSILSQVEEAYYILSDEEKRRDYDQNHGLDFSPSESLTQESSRPSDSENIFSIDRVPPMDGSFSDEDLLVAPSTDFTTPQKQTENHSFSQSPSQGFSTNDIRKSIDQFQHKPVQSSESTVPATDLYRSNVSVQSDDNEILKRIEEETEWSGSFIKEVRESCRISVEEMVDYTKISKRYLNAIEADDYDSLPVAVFVRGFVTQIAKKLRLPHEKVAQAFINRLKQHREEQ